VCHLVVGRTRVSALLVRGAWFVVRGDDDMMARGLWPAVVARRLFAVLGLLNAYGSRFAAKQSPSPWGRAGVGVWAVASSLQLVACSWSFDGNSTFGATRCMDPGSRPVSRPRPGSRYWVS